MSNSINFQLYNLHFFYWWLLKLVIVSQWIKIFEFKLLFFGCAVFSDLYLFQEIVLSDPYFRFSKTLMLLFIEKVTAGTLRLVLFS